MKAILIVCCFVAGAFAEVFLEPTTDGCVVEAMVEAQSIGRAVVLLHGAKDAGWRSISQPVFDYWRSKGCSIGAVSMPGFGASSGRRDFCGPLTLKSVHLAIERIKRELGVSNFILMGFGQGGGVAALLSAERNDIICTICSNAIGNLLQHKGEGDPLLSALQQQGYDIDFRDDASLIARSPIYQVGNITAPMFILHRRGNPVVHEQEAIDFCEAMVAAGKECRLAIREKGAGLDEQKIGFEEILEECSSWIDGFLSTHTE